MLERLRLAVDETPIDRSDLLGFEVRQDVVEGAAGRARHVFGADQRATVPLQRFYRFARRADDFADEGDLAPDARLALLAGFKEELRRIERGDPPGEPLFDQLGAIIQKYGLPLCLFHDLLSAFAQDVTKQRYATYAELIDYARRSANPVGRLLLVLFRMHHQ